MIPGFNIWWLFASNLRIVGALAVGLATYPTRVRAPTILAWIGPSLVALVFVAGWSRNATRAESVSFFTLPLLVSLPFVWFAWMARVDNCHVELSSQRARRRSEERDLQPA
jgi:hypothetical protein